ncbi:MAG TPA: amylo-alpha-1,6-glucosidase [Opitutaceae bacterium]|nr:amylo-alpha-1,6-glucosidase [Opitutaceae bacterium]
MRRIDILAAVPEQRPELLHRQWLVTNGLGGYASGTIAGAVTWRYHGLLIAALPAPFGRTLMLNHLEEWLRFPDSRVIQFGGGEPSEPGESPAPNYLVEFRLENQMPFWCYDVDGIRIEKRIVMPNRQNTVHVTYTFRSPAEGFWLELRPSVHFRAFEAKVSTPHSNEYEVRARGQQFEVDSQQGYPPLRLSVDAEEWRFIQDGGSTREIIYQLDAERGYESRGALWSPGYFSICVRSAPLTLIASTEEWHTITALDPEAAFTTECARLQRLIRNAHPDAQEGPAAELVLAADQFIIVPAGRVRDAARARAAGDELRSVIAGYHWFTDWGRDTMISLEGLALVPGRRQEAAWILRAFAHYVKDGLIPNLFPEGRNEGLYHTADATLWFFHAISRYVLMTNDSETLFSLLPLLRSIIEHHVRGTRFGIQVDPEDGLLKQGAEGYQLTWMDAKVGDWVVTPRRGKAVEINALWYNALRLLEGWLRDARELGAADEIGLLATRAQESFNRRFWNAAADCLFDVVDGEHGDDPSIRPNQVLAISLPNAVLDRSRWEAVMTVVERELLTPRGLRSLSPHAKEFKAKYSGDLRSRDAAYHQGTVWAWLIGPFVDAWIKVHPDQRTQARRFLEGFVPHLDEACVGSISEIFDAEAPFTPRGCIAQAWSVAEVLRAFVATAEGPSAEG